MENNRIEQVNFLKFGKYLSFIFILFIGIGSISIIIKGIPLGVDFAGGKQLRLAFNKQTNIDQKELKQFFQKLSIKANITTINNNQETEFFVYYPSLKDDSKKKLLLNALDSKYPKQWEIKSESFVGPKIGKQFRKIAVYSLVVTLIMLLIYIGFRFQFRFGIAAILALFHDSLFVLAFISLFRINFDISILAALLTIIGYSLNDTIVIFDRIRYELDMFTGNKLSYNHYLRIVNISIARSLSRTLLTAGTTLTVLIILIALGGTQLQPMSIILLVGIFVGTFSSNIIAPPFLCWFYKIKDSKQI